MLQTRQVRKDKGGVMRDPEDAVSDTSEITPAKKQPMPAAGHLIVVPTVAAGLTFIFSQLRGFSFMLFQCLMVFINIFRK